MAQKTLQDRDDFALLLQATSAGEAAATVTLRTEAGGLEEHPIDIAAALASAASAIGGGTTANQVRTAVRAFAAACRAQARAAGGWV